jgi:hypothetical protein
MIARVFMGAAGWWRRSAELPRDVIEQGDAHQEHEQREASLLPEGLGPL